MKNCSAPPDLVSRRRADAIGHTAARRLLDDHFAALHDKHADHAALSGEPWITGGGLGTIVRVG